MSKLLVSAVLTLSAVLGTPLHKFGGRFIPGGRIIGGHDADIADYPYQLSLMDSIGSFCGATLIEEDWAITAAHCTSGIEAAQIAVRAGSTNSDSGGQVIQVEKIYQHKDFNFATAQNDISLLKLSSKVKISTGKTIGLASSKPKAGQIAFVTGWGLTNDEDDDSVPEILQVVEVPIVDQNDCMKVYAKEGITESMICAGVLDKGGKDSCTGDSGGPLVVDGVLAGIVSWGTGCAKAGKPGVYTNVASFLDWIQEQRVSDK